MPRQRREPEINKRARYLDGVFGIPAGPCRSGFHPKIFRRLFRRGGRLVASKGKDKQARSEDFSAPSFCHRSRRVYTRKCMRRGEGVRFLQKIYSTARRTRENVSPHHSMELEGVGRGWSLFDLRQVRQISLHDRFN